MSQTRCGSSSEVAGIVAGDRRVFSLKRVSRYPAIGAASWPIGGRDGTERLWPSGLGAGRRRWMDGGMLFRSGRVEVEIGSVSRYLKSGKQAFSDEIFVATGSSGKFSEFSFF
ncbi:hypothetical protein M0R45_026342 [Rubus argutus]|uniref:Uncharacterized protein n=1 Tax=Rubus argutus TaxID=59490 RepID=A0AAW1WXB8_RUBAR